MSDCLFCKIVKGEIPSDIVFEDEHFLVFKDINPQAEIHWLVIPKQHYRDLDDMADNDPEGLRQLMQTVSKVAKGHHLSGYRTILNTGKDGGQVIFHIHAHLLAGGQLPGF